MNSVTKKELSEISTKITQNNSKLNTCEIKSAQYSELRLELIRSGLQLIADGHHFPAIISHCNANGEYNFSGDHGDAQKRCSPFGEELANLFNKVHVRTGVKPSKGFVMPINGGILIDHIEAERLISIVTNNT